MLSSNERTSCFGSSGCWGFLFLSNTFRYINWIFISCFNSNNRNLRKAIQYHEIYPALPVSRQHLCNHFPNHVSKLTWEKTLGKACKKIILKYWVVPEEIHTSLGPVYEFVCVSFRTGNLNCFRVKWPWRSTWHMCQNLNPRRKSWKWPRPQTAVST